MRLTIATIMIIIVIVICSILVVNVANFSNIDSGIISKLNVHDNDKAFSNKNLQLDDSPDHLLWFLQISDLHISKFKDPSRVTHLNEFCTKTIDTIKPAVVLASGDLTDAKTKDMLGSRQFPEEWTSYYNTLKDSNVMNKTVWLDIRGNHDNFNIPQIFHSPEDMFVQHSSQGRTHKRSYMHQVKKGEETYTFIAVDACLNPGPKRPFNFIGLLSVNDTEELINLAEKSRQLGGNYTIWFGHYPTTSILYPSSVGLRTIIGRYHESFAYLCGHFHKIGGAIPNMYRIQDEGFLELELGDWMKNRVYRVGAIDHGVFSFVDTVHNEWPVVLITNPKNSLFHIPERDNRQQQLDSSHIRLLAFSHAKIVECQIKIDKDVWQKCNQVDEKLFVLKWNPENYRKGLHVIEVIVRDADGRTKIIEQSFSMDGTRLSLDLFGRWILLWDFNKLWQSLFGIALCMCILPLCILRIWHILIRMGKLNKPRLRRFYCFGNWIQKMWILSTVDRLIIPIIGYSLYLIVGPWAIAEVIDGHYGVIFVWGIFVNGSYIPGTLQYLYGFLQLMFCQFALINIFANNSYKRFKYHLIIENTKVSLLHKIYRNLSFILIMMVEFSLAYIFWFNYGIIALVLAPMRAWSILLNIYLWHQSKNIPNKCLSSAAAVWSSEAKMNLSTQSH